MATRFLLESQRYYRLLHIRDLPEILHLLIRHGLSGVRFFDLGLRLGLYLSTLDVIKEDNKGDVRSCLRECLKAWLQQKDNVKSKSGPTYHTLVQALRKMGENDVADGIKREVTQKAGVYVLNTVTSTLHAHYSMLRQATEVCLQTIADEFYYKGLITTEVRHSPSFDKIKTGFVALLSFFKGDMTKLEEICRDFVHCLAKAGGPAKEAAIALAEDWEREVLDEHSLNWSLSIADEIDKERDIVPPTARPISTEDTPAADRIPDTQKPLTENPVNVNEWLKEGTVDLTIKRVQVHGLPGSGKTCSQHLLLNKKRPPKNNSTPIACRAVKATRISAHDDRMEIVDAKALLSRLANDLKEATPKQKEPPPKDHDTKSKEYSSKNSPTGSPKNAKARKSADTTEKKDLADDTEANKIINDIVEAIPKAEGKLDSNWVYFIDSGGQTAFQELLPLFTRASSFNIITIDLSKDIDEKLEENYRIEGASLSQVENSKFLYTNIKFLNDVLYSGAILQPYHTPGLKENTSLVPPESEENTSLGSTTPQYPQYFVLGTHKDKAKQKVIKQYNKELSSLKSGSEKKGYRIIPAIENSDRIIYAVNTMLESPEREKVAKNLCKIIHKKVSGDKIPIPVRWFAFELTLLKKAKGRSFLRKNDVLRAGRSLQMNNADTMKALQYLHNVTIILYYPQVLPDVVFVEPDPILDILSRLLALVTYQIPQEHLDHFVKEGVDLSEPEKNNLTKNGFFTQALLEKLKDDEEFPKSDFIKLLLHLHIIVETNKEGEYFLPSALPSYPKTTKPPKSNIIIDPLQIIWCTHPPKSNIIEPLQIIWCTHPPKSNIIDPLQIIWRSPVTEQEEYSRVILPVPCGIFPLAIINLMKRTEEPKFRFPNTSLQYLRYRDAMSFCLYHQKDYIGTVHIIKKHECFEHREIEDRQIEHRHIEIYFEGDASKYCSLIHEAVKEAISSSCKAIHINPDGFEFAFACPSTEGCYRIVTNEDKKKVECTLCQEPPTISGKEEYWSWFNQKSLAEGYYQLLCCNSKHLNRKWGCMFMFLFAVIIALAAYGYGMAINHFTVGTTITTGASPAQCHQYSTTVNPDSDGAGQLGIKDLDMVLTVLNKVLFGPAEWNSLGLKLGLLEPTTLDVIRVDSGGNAYEQLRKTIEAWLKGKDNARSRTWQTLIDAVEGTRDLAAAERITEELKSSYGIIL